MLSTNHQSQYKVLIDSALRAGATDIHFSVGALPIMRVDGKLRTVTEELIITAEFVTELAKHLSELDGKEFHPSSELFFAIPLEPGLRAKVTIFFQKSLPAMTIRFIPQKIQTLEQLNLPGKIADFTSMRNGLVIVTGGYGTGKTAVIASLLQSLNAHKKRYIITLERPIEYLFSSQLSIIEQREIGKDSPSFEQALTYLKHENVDVVAISSVDSERAVLTALEIARSNALVLMAIEARSIVGALERLKYVVSSEHHRYLFTLLAEAMQGAIALKLVPKIGGGLIPAYEVLFANEPVRSALEKGDTASIENIMTTGGQQGMITFDRSLLELARQHAITPEDASIFADSPKAIARVFGSRVHA